MGTLHLFLPLQFPLLSCFSFRIHISIKQLIDALFSDLLPIVRGAGAGMVLAWQPQSELVISAGNADVVKLWDVARELAIQDIPTQVDLNSLHLHERL